MKIPFFKEMRIGAYLIKQKIMGHKRYPLVLMLEPLFRCNLACVGCGKIDYPDPILNQRLSVKDCLDAVDECGAPMVAIPGGEPLIHREIGEIVKGIVARKKFVSLCTNALLLEKKLHLFEPSPYLFFSVHLDGLKEHHDKSVSQKGVFDIAVRAIKAAKAKGFTVNVNATIFDGHAAEDIAAFLDRAKELGVGVSISPGYAYERAPDQDHFLNRRKTKELFRQVFALGKGKKWDLMHSGLFLDFLAGNREYHCTPWGMPTRNLFGWQKPCYLLGEGYAKSYKELIETTDWDLYGTGQVREVRQLHGPLRLRADRGACLGQQSVERAVDRLARRAHVGTDGAGNLTRRSSGRRSSSSPATSTRCCTKFMRPSPRPGPFLRSQAPAAGDAGRGGIAPAFSGQTFGRVKRCDAALFARCSVRHRFHDLRPGARIEPHSMLTNAHCPCHRLLHPPRLERRRGGLLLAVASGCLLRAPFRHQFGHQHAALARSRLAQARTCLRAGVSPL